MVTIALKIREIKEFKGEDLPQWLAERAKNADKSIAQICRECGFSTQYWYDLVKGVKSSINEKTLARIEQSIGTKYPRIPVEED